MWRAPPSPSTAGLPAGAPQRRGIQPVGAGDRPARLRSVEVPLLVSTGFVPAAMIVPERGVRVSQVQHRGLAGMGPGHYRDGVSNGKCVD